MIGRESSDQGQVLPFAFLKIKTPTYHSVTDLVDYQTNAVMAYPHVFLDCEMTLVNEIMEDFIRLGSAQGCVVQAGTLKSD